MSEENKGSQPSSANQYEFDFPKNKMDEASKDLKEQFANPKGEQTQENEQNKEERGDLKLEYNPPEDPRLKELREISDKIKSRTEAQKQLSFNYDKGRGNDGLEM